MYCDKWITLCIVLTFAGCNFCLFTDISHKILNLAFNIALQRSIIINDNKFRGDFENELLNLEQLFLFVLNVFLQFSFVFVRILFIRCFFCMT